MKESKSASGVDWDDVSKRAAASVAESMAPVKALIAKAISDLQDGLRKSLKVSVSESLSKAGKPAPTASTLTPGQKMLVCAAAQVLQAKRGVNRPIGDLERLIEAELGKDLRKTAEANTPAFLSAVKIASERVHGRLLSTRS